MRRSNLLTRMMRMIRNMFKTFLNVCRSRLMMLRNRVMRRGRRLRELRVLLWMRMKRIWERGWTRTWMIRSSLTDSTSLMI